MRVWKKIMTSVLAAALLLSLSGTSVWAAKEDYTYTVTFLAGVQGIFGGAGDLSVNGTGAVISQSADKIVVSGLQSGDVVSFNAQSSVALDADSKHYVQGVRLSGRDNDTVADSVFVVDSDKDYVVAYGIKGNMTSYTVHYQDEDGKELLPDDVFYGNVGDKPVVAYRYVEGYTPQVLGYTKTLSENAAENVFTFIYEDAIVEDSTQAGSGTGTGTGTGTGDQDGSGEAEEPGDTGEPGSTDEPGNAEVPGDTDEPGSTEVPGDTGESGGTDEPGDTDNSDAPDDSESPIVDLDDEETPLGNIDVDKDNPGIPLVGMIAIIGIALVALANIVFFVVRRVRRK